MPLKTKTACPLDCYDACEIIYEDGIKAERNGYTAGFLCPHLNHYEKFETIETPRYMGKDITMQEAMELLKDMVASTLPKDLLYYRGSGNFALMQEVVEHFFASFGATSTDGSLCDSAGESGIIDGRGSNKNITYREISKADVIVVWGRNIDVTSSHLLPHIKGKTLIVIDPRKIDIAKRADLHIQLKPKGDLSLAMLISRFLVIYDYIDEEYLEKMASEYEEYYELTQSLRLNQTLEDIDVDLSDIEIFLELTKGKKVVTVCGIGIQKYIDGADVMRSIDALAVMLGSFGKSGSGVAYLGNSKEGISSPFVKAKTKISKVDTEFSNFKTVFIQGANPLCEMPNTLRVKESIEKVKNLIYFGLYENETSELAQLVIPAKSFLYKNDIRVSYSHNQISEMPRVLESEIGISEYDLSDYLCDEFKLHVDSEEFYLSHFKSFSTLQDDVIVVKNREEIPYKNGFDTPSKEFEFLDEFEKFKPSDKLYLITPKSRKSLNSQFKRESRVYLHSALGFKSGSKVEVSSNIGKVTLEVEIDDDLREDCTLIYSGTKGVNNLTTSKHSLDGKCAIFQEMMVELSQCKK